jgi:phosphoribosylaminoimidazolecarboxamide formyltransferase/IMP cyclohydrolase
VVVNIHPFEDVAARTYRTVEQAMDAIDIGGLALIRSAVKNQRYVAVVTDPDDYDRVLRELRQNGEVPAGLRAELALKAIRLTARYDRTLASYLAANIEGRFPSCLSLDFVKAQDLRYGENPHQAAAFYREPTVTEPSTASAAQLSGDKALSYNNLFDLNGALELVKEFEGPAAAIIKHANPCGGAVAATLTEAFDRAFEGDPISAFGGILAVNRTLDPETAEHVVRPSGTDQPKFFEVIVAPDYDKDALETITRKPKWGVNVRVMRTGPWARASFDAKAYDFKRVVGGLLVQDRDLALFDREIRVVTERQPTEAQWRDLRFAMVCAKHVKSNAIVFAKDRMLVGVGAGQMSRIDATMVAAHKAGERARGSVLASDAFFPFPDVVEAAAKAGCAALIQPGGAMRDQLSIDKANELGLAMVFSGLRHFLH